MNDIVDLLLQRDNFYISGHVGPDGDSIGACFGLGLALEKMGKKVQIMLETIHPRFDVIPGRHLLEEKLADGEVLICLDCADITRLPKGCKKLAEKLECTLNIDHHYTNTNFAKHNLVDSEASSTCEMIYHLLEFFSERDFDLWDKNIASAVYAGMVSDTGGFRFNATSQDTLKAVGKLINMDIPFTEIYTEMVHMRSYTELKLLARVLENTQLAKDGRIVYCCVNEEMMKNFNNNAPDATSQDLEGVVELLLNVRGAEISFLVYDRDEGEAKISLRSRGVNVAEVAKKFGGGGHQLAAGATVKKKDLLNVSEIGWQVLNLL